MGQAFDWHKDYYHKDDWYGLNDWYPVVAFVRGLMENSEDVGCFPRAKARVMMDNSLMSQTLIQYFGSMQDERGIEIIEAKLAVLSENDIGVPSEWCDEGTHFELLCLESLARIGGKKARAIIDKYRNDSAKSYLAEGIEKLEIADEPRSCVVPYGQDFPEILKGVRTFQEIFGDGGEVSKFSAEKAGQMEKAWRSLKWPGPIEYLSGDGQTNTFKMKYKVTDHIHDFADPYSDFGIFLSNPKIEYPIGRRR